MELVPGLAKPGPQGARPHTGAEVVVHVQRLVVDVPRVRPDQQRSAVRVRLGEELAVADAGVGVLPNAVVLGRRELVARGVGQVARFGVADQVAGALVGEPGAHGLVAGVVGAGLGAVLGGGGEAVAARHWIRDRSLAAVPEQVGAVVPAV